MTKKLVIAEKPSVAGDIARALGGFTRKGDYFESDEYIVSSAVGHLLELALPETHDVKKGKWSFAKLPVIPPHFELAPIEKNENRLNVLLRLLKRKDVTGLINACDAGREGELIFRYIVQYAKTKKPIERLWLQSMTQGAIREGFETLRKDKDLLPLADAAKSRSEADWLVGINGTRAMTAFNSKEGGFYLTTVGRVQTPTLAILVEREEKIRAFQPRDYWEVHARFGAKAGEYAGRWFDPAFKKDDDTERKPERLWEKKRAEALAAACSGRPGVATEETKPSTQSSPLLYDLTSLQREANGRFGFSARGTLALAQALYEKHKVLTYPRTDSRALPEDYLGTVKKTLEMLGQSREFAPFAKQVLKSGWVKPNKRIFDNAKISDHFAIIPTLQAPKHLSEPEAKLYDLVVRRFLAVFFPSAEFLQTTRITKVGEAQFRTDGRVLQNPGWLAVYGRAEGGEDQNLPAITQGEKVSTLEAKAEPNQTRPPPRYSEATLLSAMEGAGKLVEDDELREAMGAKGLGTPATRAATIEGLIREEYIHRNGRELVPTPKAFSLMFALHMLGIVELASPELTGEWEYKLRLMEQGRLTREAFMSEISALVKNTVNIIKHGEIPDVVYATVSAACPKCGGVVQENYRKFQCQKCDFAIWKVTAGREWSPEEIAELIAKRVIGPLTGFRSRMGKPFSAVMRLSDEFKVEFDFGQAGEDEPAPDFSGQTPLGECPKCAARVFEHGMAYTCEKALGAGKTCDFRSGRMILQQPIERAQMEKLLATGRTDLLTGFVSKKNRKFKAFLVKQPTGKIGFEFQPRAEKAPAKDGAGKPASKDKPAEEKARRRGSERRARSTR
ncbi:MAG TPA: DNA topoisomerase III [Burkholderiales bacterium]|jgi:DNA topoisomerase-3|nr:DNA topoisomerase III [Burkholderiales bacterium]